MAGEQLKEASGGGAARAGAQAPLQSVFVRVARVTNVSLFEQKETRR